MPTRAEFEELIDNCTWEWTAKGGRNGYKVTGPNGNSIFLPAAGCCGIIYNEESVGYYWSATPDEGSTRVDACSLCFYSGYRDTRWEVRFGGHSVRPILD